MSPGWFVAIALLAAVAWRGCAGYPRPERPRRVLSRAEWATVEAVAEALFPPGGAVAPSGREAGVAAYADRLVAASQPRQRLLMRALFFLIEHGTLLFPAPGGPSGLRRFSSLDARQREAVIESWQGSGLFLRRLVFTSLRAICTLGYFADPEVQRALRLAPYAIETPVVEADLLYPPVGRSTSGIGLDEGDLTEAGRLPPLTPDAPRAAGSGGVR